MGYPQVTSASGSIIEISMRQAFLGKVEIIQRNSQSFTLSHLVTHKSIRKWWFDMLVFWIYSSRKDLETNKGRKLLLVWNDAASLLLLWLPAKMAQSRLFSEIILSSQGTSLSVNSWWEKDLRCETVAFILIFFIKRLKKYRYSFIIAVRIEHAQIISWSY